MITRLGRAGDRSSEYVCVNCANLLCISGAINLQTHKSTDKLPKLEGTGDRFGVYTCVDCVTSPCIGGHNQLTNTKFTRPVTKISESTGRMGWMAHRKWKEIK